MQVPDGTCIDPDLPQRPLEECVTALRKVRLLSNMHPCDPSAQGSWLLKYGRYGKPKLHYFRLINHDSQLAWRSANGTRRTVDLPRVRELQRGQGTEVFKRYPQQAVTALSFSLMYAGPDNDTRSLDLICPGEDTFALWFAGLQVCVSKVSCISCASPHQALVGNRSTSMPVLGKALAFDAPPKPPLPPANPAAPAPGRVSGDIGLPVRSRTPGDLWIWGSPTPADRATDGTREPGRIAAMRFKEPHMVQETKQLDVLKVGVVNSPVVMVVNLVNRWRSGCVMRHW